MGNFVIFFGLQNRDGMVQARNMGMAFNPGFPIYDPWHAGDLASWGILR